MKNKKEYHDLMKDQKDRRFESPFITISYEVGACARDIVDNLGEYLRNNEKRKDCYWKIFDKDLLKRVVEDHHLPDTVLPYLSESTASEIGDIVEETFGIHPSRHTLVNKMNETILNLATSGYVVIVGRGAHIVTAKLPKGVHIRLIGSLEKRILYIQQCFKIKEDQAREYVIKEGRRRASYCRKYFSKDINDPLLYDLIINTDRLSYQDIIRDIGEAALKRFR